MSNIELAIYISFVWWTLAGVVCTLLIKLPDECFDEYPLYTFFSCFILGPLWWIIYAVRQIQRVLK